MNIYNIEEDFHENFCVQAKTMAEATKIAEKLFLADRKDRLKKQYEPEKEKKRYYVSYLKSCTFVGRLKN